MDQSILQDYIDKNTLPLVEKKFHKYLTFENMEDDYTYILKDGVVKESVVSKYGQEFNLRYVTGLEIISVLNDEFSPYMGEPYNVRVESPKATFYRVSRKKFLQDVNKDIQLQRYIKSFYHNRLQASMKKMQCMLTNGRVGALATQLNELALLFGERDDQGHVKINFSVTNEELGKFCGISTASSVSRILKQLKDEGIIQTDRKGLVITNMEQLEDYITF